jgi:hypothetical protein
MAPLLMRALALACMFQVAATEQTGNTTRLNKTQLGFNSTETKSTVHRRELGQVHAQDSDAGPADSSFDGGEVPIVGGMVGNLLARPGPPLNLGQPGPPLNTKIPFVDDTDDVTDQAVSAQSVKGGRVSTQARGGRGGRGNQPEQVQAQDSDNFKPEDTPLVGGLVGKIMNKPIPFVGKKDDEEEAQGYEYGYDDPPPSTNGLSSTPVANAPTEVHE